MSETAQRFTLDETRAAEWIGRAITEYEEGTDNPDPTLPDLGADYWPAMEEDGSGTFLLVTAALEAGIIADGQHQGSGSPSVVFEFIPDGDGDGYRWLLYGSDCTQPITASHIHSMSHLGDGYDAKGADAAMAVLREATDEGNGLVHQMAAYAAVLRVSEADRNRKALDAIQYMLRDPEWGAGMLEDIADLVRATGRDVENLPGDEPTWGRH